MKIKTGIKDNDNNNNKNKVFPPPGLSPINWMLHLGQNAGLWNGVILRLEQHLEKHICFNRLLQGLAEFPHRIAMKTFLHLPALQHLVDLLSQTVTRVVMLDGVDLHLREAQLPGAGFPLQAYVLPDQLQMFFGYSVFFCTRTTTTRTRWIHKGWFLALHLVDLNLKYISVYSVCLI